LKRFEISVTAQYQFSVGFDAIDQRVSIKEEFASGGSVQLRLHFIRKR